VKGLKGERRAYGLTSPLDSILLNAGFFYKGSRFGRDTKKPSIMYETDRGCPAELEEFDNELLNQGYEHHRDLDGETEVYPQHGVPGRGQHYTMYRYEKRGSNRNVSEVLYVITRFYDAGKGKKDYTSFDHIFY
jgi:hypothetical protein